MLFPAAAAAIVTAAACATIMHGTTQDVGISSTPTGSSVTIDNKPLGNTPVIAKLARKDHHIVKIEMPGYQPFESTITRKVSGWVWGNILFGGLIGLAVDAISGGLYKLTPEQVAGTLQRSDTSDKEDTVVIMVVLAPDPAWQRIGSLVKQNPE